MGGEDTDDEQQIQEEETTMDSKIRKNAASDTAGDDAANEESDEEVADNDDENDDENDDDSEEDNEADETDKQDVDDDDNDDDKNEEEEDNDEDDGDDDDEQDEDNDDEDEQDNEEEEEDQDDAEEEDDEEEDDSSDDDEDDESSVKKVLTEDGREISEYEMLRLERIRRNKEKLAALGLEGQHGGGVLGEKKKSAKKKKKPRPSIEHTGPKRSSLSRRSKGKITHYAAELPSVRQLLQGTTAVKKEKSEKKQKKSKDPSERMDRVLHDEFRRIRSEKKTILRQAERDNRAATKEVKYWKNQVQISKRRELREQKRQVLQVHKREEEKEVLGGKTARQMLQEVDKRMPELLQAAEKYDEKYEAEARLRERELQRFEMEERMKTIDALERYPKILKDANSLLSTVFIERAPKDPPPPRRSKRAGEEDEKPEQPKKKKAKTKTDDEEPWTQQAPISAVNLPKMEEEPSSPPKSAPSTGKKRKRGVRNVGGWVSPDFAQKIDRSWLERDTPPTKFDLKTFSPQVGDTVLYYPRGHLEFLAEYPDVLGKKTRQMTRVPLWERLGRKKEGDEAEDTLQSNTWCTEEWAQSVTAENGGGRYPLLCTVQTVCAEFPPDPNIKIVKKKEGADGEEIKKVFFKGPKNGINKEPAKIRLAVTLRPLSPVVPGMGLALPPTFSVVTFPSKKKPFLIPFAWAYSLNHAMSFGTTVFERSDPDSLKRISKVDIPEGIPNEGRIDSHKAGSLLDFLGDKQSRKEKLAKILAEDPRQFPVCDALVALGTLESIAKKDAPPDSTIKNSDFIDIICDTLPVWEAATVTSKDVYDRKKRTVQVSSPWELCLAQKNYQQHEATPDRIAELPSDRDESLRMKIEVVFDEIIKDHESAPIFTDPITEDMVPSYYCAVPVGMWISRIQKRLKGTTKSKGCLYRSVGAILSDISAIVENCLLYNSPESEVVEAAVEVTTALKDGISRVVREHNKEVNALQKADEERRRHVMQLCGSGAQGPSRSSVTVCRIRKPFKHVLYRDWLQEVRNTAEHQSPVQNGESKPKYDWIPQAGDDILYSRSVHSKFVKGHQTALELDQCETVSADFSFKIESGVDDWFAGRVVWTKGVFPRALTKKDIDSPSFSTNSTILALGVMFSAEGDTEKLHVIYWRPCMFHFEREGCHDHCKICGVSAVSSFIRQANPQNSNGRDSESVLSQDETKNIERCFSLLKKRVSIGLTPSFVDPDLNKTSIKQGYETPSARDGLQTLPSYENLLLPITPSSSHSKRKGGARLQAPPAALTQSGYLVHWMSEKQNGGKDSLPKHHETISPWPKMCLELVRLRLKNGYYRSRAALENDLIEAFSSICLLLVAEPASQKKSPLSELYSVALASVTETERFERISGLYVKVEPTISVKPAVEKAKQNSAQIEAREKLRILLDAVGKDNLSDDLPKRGPGTVPTTKLSVICNGEKTEYEKFMTTVKRAVATKGEKDLKVKIMCEGKEVHVDRELPKKSFVDAFFNGSNVKLKVIASGEETAVADTSRLGRSTDVKEVINNFISIGARDMEGSETLVKFLFGRPRRSSVCARCSAHRRNMLICRVRRAHANHDFDWMDFFQDCNGIDEILETMKTGKSKSDGRQDNVPKSSSEQQPSEPDKTMKNREKTDPPLSPAKTTKEDVLVKNKEAARSGAEDSKEKDSSLLDQEKVSGDRDGAPSVPEDDETDSCTEKVSPKRARVYSTRNRRSAVSEEKEENEEAKHAAETENHIGGDKAGGDQNHVKESNVETGNAEKDAMGIDNAEKENEVQIDPELAVQKAETALALSELVLDEARRFAKAPARLSKDFIRTSVPIDKDDGHYIYCIICGLSGNLLCCDGCANVLHSGCIGLEKVPEGEWFCEECNTKKPATKAGGEDSSEGGSGKNPASEGLSTKKAVPVPADDAITAKSVPDTMQGCNKLPFGRLDFDQDRADRLTALVQELHDLRPDLAIRRERDQQRKKKHRKGDGGASDSEGSDAEGGFQEQKFDSTDPLIELTDTAKSFLSAIRINNYTDFLASKTSDIANKFARWRKKNGLVELRGSGTTAYVSTWKRTCREIAAERDLYVPEESGGVIYKEDSELESDTDAGEGGSRKKRGRKSFKSPRRRKSRAKVIENPWDVLSAQSQEFLKSIGIHDADGFMEMRTTDISAKYVKWRRKKQLPKLKSNGEVATVSAWKTAVRKAAETLESLKKTDAKGRVSKVQGTPTKSRSSNLQNQTPKGRSATNTQTTQSPKKVDTAQGRAERAKKRKSREPTDTGGGKVRKQDLADDYSEDGGKPPFDNALEVLTPTAQEFLRDEGISSAEDFLSQRSGEMGERFGQWRKKKGMAKLRGSGEGATISAWKSLCRKAVAALERYREKLGTSDSIRVIEVEEASTPAPRRGRRARKDHTPDEEDDETPASTPEVKSKKRSRAHSPGNGVETSIASPAEAHSPEVPHRQSKRTRRSRG
eukprot:scaffold2013_cov139-Amphora_coffeaeformis.AAC.2